MDAKAAVCRMPPHAVGSCSRRFSRAEATVSILGSRPASSFFVGFFLLRAGGFQIISDGRFDHFLEVGEVRSAENLDYGYLLLGSAETTSNPLGVPPVFNMKICVLSPDSFTWTRGD